MGHKAHWAREHIGQETHKAPGARSTRKQVRHKPGEVQDHKWYETLEARVHVGHKERSAHKYVMHEGSEQKVT